MRKTGLTTTTVLVAGLGLMAAPAPAAPERETIPLDCGSAGSFDITVNGNGDFTPGRDANGTTVIVPISFQNERFLVTAPDGTVLVDETETERLAKGSVPDRSPRQQVDCSFSASFVLDAEEDGIPAGSTIAFYGEVTGYLTPSR